MEIRHDRGRAPRHAARYGRASPARHRRQRSGCPTASTTARRGAVATSSPRARRGRADLGRPRQPALSVTPMPSSRGGSVELFVEAAVLPSTARRPTSAFKLHRRLLGLGSKGPWAGAPCPHPLVAQGHHSTERMCCYGQRREHQERQSTWTPCACLGNHPRRRQLHPRRDRCARFVVSQRGSRTTRFIAARSMASASPTRVINVGSPARRRPTRR